MYAMYISVKIHEIFYNFYDNFKYLIFVFFQTSKNMKQTLKNKLRTKLIFRYFLKLR